MFRRAMVREVKRFDIRKAKVDMGGKQRRAAPIHMLGKDLAKQRNTCRIKRYRRFIQ